MKHTYWIAVALIATGQVRADDSAVRAALAREIIWPRQTLVEASDFIEKRLARLSPPKSVEDWEKEAARLRKAVLEQVVFRGDAAAWRDAKIRVEWLDTIDGGSGYRIKKLRYEAVPGMWIPALLYEPEKLQGKVPVALAVNGHDRAGKAADYKQLRCINLAKRGHVVLNLEWVGMGQLATPGFRHGCMNQLDLCGTSGLAPHYLAMTRGIDILLAHPNADADRLSVSGLSGGGWQTIFVSALDTRVKLCNPVAGYSGFRTKFDHVKDLGDSEQTPNDFASVADYTHLTAMLAPRPALLTFNARDRCCYEAGYALPPLLAAASPVYKLYGKEKSLRSHVNEDPGDHNYGPDNRQAFYRLLGDFFHVDEKGYNREEIDSKSEVKSKEELAVELPKDNADFNKLALSLARTLPREGTLPTTAERAKEWQRDTRVRLRDVLRLKEDWKGEAEQVGSTEMDGLAATSWKVKVGGEWTVPVVELIRGQPKATAILLNDAGRKADPAAAGRLLDAGYRVLAVDLFYFGEAKVIQKDWLYSILIASAGQRPLGVQTAQLAAVARWAASQFKGEPPTVVAIGPRTGTIALCAAALEEKAIGSLELHGPLGSFKEIIEQNRTVDQTPELFCFGLLPVCDVRQLAALVAPRPVRVARGTDRVRTEFRGLKEWYTTLRADFDPAADLAPDLIVHNAKVVTVDAKFSTAEAVAIADGRVVAVGTDKDVLSLKGKKTRVIDAKGKTVLPGLYDSHTHPTGAAFSEAIEPLPALKSLKDVLAYIRKKAEKTPEGDWIVVRYAFPTRLDEARFPTRKELDEAAPKHPVLYHAGPAGLVNTMGLTVSKITKDTPNPRNGVIVKDPKTGEPTGMLRSAYGALKGVPIESDKLSPADKRAAVKKLFHLYNEHGLTSVADRNANRGALDLYLALRKDDELTVRVNVARSFDPSGTREQVAKRFDDLPGKDKRGGPTGVGDEWVRVGPIKLFLDGGMLNGTAYMRQPWPQGETYQITETDYRGLLFIQPEQLQMVAEEAAKRKWQVTAHTAGEGAMDVLLDAYEIVDRLAPIKDLRFCITHANFPSKRNLEICKKLNVCADVQPAWLYKDGTTLLKVLGEERVRWFQPYKSWLEYTTVGGGSDHMIKFDPFDSTNPWSPWLGIGVAVDRVTERGTLLTKDERLTREQAIRLYTINNAYLHNEEKEKGSLEVGKLGDLIVIDRDVLTCPSKDIRDTKVLLTVVGGKVVYERKD